MPENYEYDNNEPNSWAEYRRLILSLLEELKDRLDEMEEKQVAQALAISILQLAATSEEIKKNTNRINKLSKELAVIKVKIAIVAGVISVVGGCLPIILQYLLSLL